MELFTNEFFQEYYFKQRLSFKQIGRKFNKSTGTVFNYFHKLGFKAIIPDKAWNSGITCKDDSRILSGENHPRWQNKSKYYIEFDLKRREIINGKTKCERCGNIANTLHHKDKNTDNNSDNNLQPLCSSCHTTIHNLERGHHIYRHNCDWCGKEIVKIGRPSCKQRCCSLYCKSKLAYKEGKVLLHNHNGRTMYQHTCKNCGKDFSSVSTTSVFCSNPCKLHHLSRIRFNEKLTRSNLS